MQDKKVLILIALVSILVIPLLIAQQPVYRQNRNITLRIPCTNNGSICSTGATCEATIIDSEGRIIRNNDSMTQAGALFLMNLSDNETTYIGQYEFTATCNDGGGTNSAGLTFLVTPNGEEVTEGKAFFYVGALIVLMFFVVFAILGFRNTNEIWLKALCFYIIWGVFIAINYVAWIACSNYLYTISFAASFFKWLWVIQTYATFPLVLGSFLWYIYLLIMNKNMKRMLDHGVPEDRAVARQIKNDLNYFKRRGRR